MENKKNKLISKEILKNAFTTLVTAKAMTEIYEKNFKTVSKYVHATSRGHEVIQIAAGMQLLPQDYVFPYYRDDSILLSIGMTPYELMLQVLAKKDDPFSGGRTYYSHQVLMMPTSQKFHTKALQRECKQSLQRELHLVFGIKKLKE